MRDAYRREREPFLYLRNKYKAGIYFQWLLLSPRWPFIATPFVESPPPSCGDFYALLFRWTINFVTSWRKITIIQWPGYTDFRTVPSRFFLTHTTSQLPVQLCFPLILIDFECTARRHACFQRFFRAPRKPVCTSGWISGWEQNGNFIRQLKHGGPAYLCFARALR